MSEGDIVINPQTSMSLKDRVMIMQTKLDLPEDVSIIQILHIQTTRSHTLSHTLIPTQTDMPWPPNYPWDEHSRNRWRLLLNVSRVINSQRVRADNTMGWAETDAYEASYDDAGSW